MASPGRPRGSILVDDADIRDMVQELLLSYQDKLTLLELDFCRRMRADTVFSSSRAKCITALFQDVPIRSETWAALLKLARKDYVRIDKERHQKSVNARPF